MNKSITLQILKDIGVQLEDVFSFLTKEEISVLLFVVTRGFFYLTEEQSEIYNTAIMKLFPRLNFSPQTSLHVGSLVKKMKSFDQYKHALGHPELAWAIVANQNTPKDIAIDIIEKAYQAFVQNILGYPFAAKLVSQAQEKFDIHVAGFLSNRNVVLDFVIKTTKFSKVTADSIIELHKDDEEILSYLHKCKYLSCEQLNHVFFNLLPEEKGTLVVGGTDGTALVVYDSQGQILSSSNQPLYMQVKSKRKTTQKMNRFWHRHVIVHPNCSSELFERLYDYYKSSLSEAEFFLKNPLMSTEAAIGLLERVGRLDGYHWIEIHKKEFIRILGETMFENYISTLKLKE